MQEHLMIQTDSMHLRALIDQGIAAIEERLERAHRLTRQIGLQVEAEKSGGYPCDRFTRPERELFEVQLKIEADERNLAAFRWIYKATENRAGADYALSLLDVQMLSQGTIHVINLREVQ